MDAQVTFGNSSVPKTAMVFFVSIAAAFLLGGAGGYVAKGLVADQRSQHAAPSVVVQQPVGTGESYRPQRSGLQLGDDGMTLEYTLGAMPTRPGGPRS